MTTLNEPNRLSDLLKMEPDSYFGREVVTIKSSVALLMGTVIGKVSVGALTAVGAASVPAPAAATITASPVAVGAKVGVHRFVALVGGAGTASKWQHEDPEGEYAGVATGNTEYTGGGLTLTITDAGTDPVPGEAFIVTVTAAAGSGKYAQLTPAAVDGTADAIAVLLRDADASAGDVTDVIVLTRGPSIVVLEKLIWPAGISAGNKAAALAALEARNITTRSEV
ncbi:MAG: head decoration protein [Parvibaculum sp.]|nr:head decoration protein [Parvibaculum sp.]